MVDFREIYPVNLSTAVVDDMSGEYVNARIRICDDIEYCTLVDVRTRNGGIEFVCSLFCHGSLKIVVTADGYIRRAIPIHATDLSLFEDNIYLTPYIK